MPPKKKRQKLETKGMASNEEQEHRNEATSGSKKIQAVWIQLYIGSEKNGSPFSIKDLPGGETVEDLAKKVKEECNELKNIESRKLTVFPPVTTGAKAERVESLRPSMQLSEIIFGVTLDDENPLVVVAPGPLSTWIQLYIGNKKEGSPFFIKDLPGGETVKKLTERVKEKRNDKLKNIESNELKVFPPVTTGAKAERVESLRPIMQLFKIIFGFNVDDENPLVVVAPGRLSTWIQLYIGNKKEGGPFELEDLPETLNLKKLTERVKEKRNDKLEKIESHELKVFPPVTKVENLEQAKFIRPDIQLFKIIFGFTVDYKNPLVVVSRPLSDPSTKTGSRLIDIRFQVKDQELLQERDLSCFLDRIKDLFEWYEGDERRREYMAPYFPLVQSSGSGKTKLLYHAYKKLSSHHSDIQSYFILCDPEPSNIDKKEEIYTNTLCIPKTALGEARVDVCKQLDSIIKTSKQEKVLIMLDEAQSLLANDAFLFRCIRWWLRNKRRVKKVVAVFSGTTSGLANYYHESPTSNFSRDASSYHASGKKLHQPFFDLCTTGILAKREYEDNFTDFDIAVYYGRPLFAVMHKDGKLKVDSENQITILRRMTLSCWMDWGNLQEADDEACLSILGTRVQMGQTSISIASKLVKKGYANLTYFSSKASMAQIAFFPDATCARLAMGMMDPCWNLGEFKGYSKQAWSKKMSAIISTGLCRPYKGDLGEVTCALYLLFCGDELRRCLSTQYCNFAVPLNAFFEYAIDPTKELKEEETQSDSKTSVNFIQVCRNHYRPKLKDMFSFEKMEWLYNASCACYSYSGCPTFDLYAPIRYFEEKGNKKKYAPMLVSVKARTDIAISAVSAEFNSMVDTIKEVSTGGVCVLFLVGLDDPSKHVSTIFKHEKGKRTNRSLRSNQYQEGDRQNPKLKASSDDEAIENDGNDRGGDEQDVGGDNENSKSRGIEDIGKEIYCVLISVPVDDKFGLYDVVTETSVDGDAISEVYTSHAFLHPHARSKNDQESEPQNLLRRKHDDSSDVFKYFDAIHDAFSKIDADKNVKGNAKGE